MTGIRPDWIALDWGTTHLRGWAMTDDGQVLAEARSDRGMGGLAPEEFAAALTALAPWARAAPAVACGMVGARQGWIEAPYGAVPCPPLSQPFARAPVAPDSPPVLIVPGLKQDRPADVMRGEETQIAGFLALNPGWDGVLCLPGTHSKWAEISAGEVVSFRSFMTGEIFALLGKHSVLRHSVQTDDWDDKAFATALSETLSRPESLAARLFTIRADGLLHGLGTAAARSRLSGLLIGAELAAAKPYWLGREIAVIAAGSLARVYVAALALQSVAATQANAERVTLAGLTAARRLTKETA